MNPSQKRRRKNKKKPKSDQANEDSLEAGRITGIDRLNLGEPAKDSENDSE